LSTASPIDAPAPSLATLEDAVGAAEDRYQRALAHVRDAVARSAGGADTFQLQIYDLAFLRAGLSAAGAMLRWARSLEASTEAEFAASMAGLFTAETVADLRMRLGMRAVDYGTTREALEAPFIGLIDGVLQQPPQRMPSRRSAANSWRATARPAPSSCPTTSA